MKRILFFVSIVLSGILSAQSNSKMDYYLASKIEAYQAKKADAEQMLPMLIQGNIGVIKQLVLKSGGVFKYSYGNIAAIVIPVSSLQTFNESGAVTRMEGAPKKMQPCNDTMRKRNSITAVQLGLSPLPQDYKGKGIVIGFIDTGIDFLHPDFIDSTGHSRVKYYWDMNRPLGLFTPLPYGYGQAWTGAEIDAHLANDSASMLDYGHGSNVAGVATSNGRANGLETGGAPECDIIMVAYNFDSQRPTMMTDAVNYIFTMADSLNEPCVINASLGTYNVSHDGLDLDALMIDSMILAKQPGRVFVAAAGNGGGIPFHLHDSLPAAPDTTCTWFVYDGGNGNVDIPLFADSADFSNIQFAIEVDKVTTGSINERAITSFSNISAHLGHNSIAMKNTNGDVLDTVNYYGQISNHVYSMEFIINTDSTRSGYYWKLITAGQGRFDCWDMSYAGGTDIVDTTGFMLSQTKYPEMAHYVQPDVNQTILSSFQCSPQVITDANYFNRKCWRNYLGHDTCWPASTPGKLAPSSSWGPSRNYRLVKPDIGGAGAVTMSALPSTLQAAAIASDKSAIDSLGWHNEDGGTSLSSPGVASVAALILERYPTAKYKAVWYTITHCDSVDGFTGAVPNYKFGYGKVDAFKALTGGCIFTGIDEIKQPDNGIILKAYPNPTVSGAIVEYDFSTVKNFTLASIVFYDMLGKVVQSIPLKYNQGSVSIEKNMLPAGMYFYSLLVDGSRLKTEKLDVL